MDSAALVQYGTQFWAIKGELWFPRPRIMKGLFPMDKKQELAAEC